MNTAIFYDTETTGIPAFRDPSDAEHQPHIVQLGATLVDMESRRVLQTMDVIVRPDGWEIPKESTETHGITHEHALEVGIPESLALDMLLELWKGRTRIAHNEQFDQRIIRIGLKRFMQDHIADEWKEGEAVCTARKATPIVNLPPTDRMKAAGRHHAKTPNLMEAYQHFFGHSFEGAHTAIADVHACMDIYWALVDYEAQEAEAETV